MGSGNNILPWAALIILFVGFQAVFILADCKSSAPQSAEAFIRAYYAMKPSVGDMVCNDLTDDGIGDPVGHFFDKVAKEARELGHSPKYMRTQMMSLHVETINQTEDTAVVHVSGTRRRNINPVFTFIARLPLFNLGSTFPVEKTLEMVKEDGRWRVCSDMFDRVHVKQIYGQSI